MLEKIYAKIMEANPLAVKIVIGDSGHICNMENVSEVNRAVKTFLGQRTWQAFIWEGTRPLRFQ